MGWSRADEDIQEGRVKGRKEGLLEAANWLRRQANAEDDLKSKAAFIEAHNAILALAEGRNSA